MSFRSDKLMSLAGEDFSGKTLDELRKLFREYLDNGIHGLCYSAYQEGQAPGSIITDEQIRARIGIIKPYVRWIRTFSCTDGNELIPGIAKQNGLKVMAGAWLGEDNEKNEEEISNL